VVERPRVGNRCLNTPSFWIIIMMDIMETERGHLEGPVEHSEGKGGKSVVAISRFLCGSRHLCWLRIEGLVPMSKY
jgi:hypothetical protein